MEVTNVLYLSQHILLTFILQLSKYDNLCFFHACSGRVRDNVRPDRQEPLFPTLLQIVANPLGYFLLLLNILKAIGMFLLIHFALFDTSELFDVKLAIEI